MTSVAPRAASTGDAAAETTGSTMRAERPMLVYITSSDETDGATRKLEDVVFANEQFAIGTKFFDAVKISLADAEQDRILADAGRRGEAPRIVLIGRDYEIAAVLEGKRITAGKLLKAMSHLARDEYVNSFDKMVKGYVKLLTELDRLEGKKANIADQKARLQAKPNPSKAKKIARDEEKLEAEMTEWSAKEKELLALQFKGEKTEA